MVLCRCSCGLWMKAHKGCVNCCLGGFILLFLIIYYYAWAKGDDLDKAAGWKKLVADIGHLFS